VIQRRPELAPSLEAVRQQYHHQRDRNRDEESPGGHARECPPGESADRLGKRGSFEHTQRAQGKPSTPDGPGKSGLSLEPLELPPALATLTEMDFQRRTFRQAEGPVEEGEEFLAGVLAAHSSVLMWFLPSGKAGDDERAPQAVQRFNPKSRLVKRLSPPSRD
jgi:hypothetical protein